MSHAKRVSMRKRRGKAMPVLGTAGLLASHRRIFFARSPKQLRRPDDAGNDALGPRAAAVPTRLPQLRWRFTRRADRSGD